MLYNGFVLQLKWKKLQHNSIFTAIVGVFHFLAKR